MAIQNKIQIDDVSQFSSNDEVALATVGRYGKYQGHGYRITIIKDVVFIHTWESCSVELPSHYPFKYKDDAGEHTVEQETKTIEVKGITSFNFIYR